MGREKGPACLLVEGEETATFVFMRVRREQLQTLVIIRSRDVTVSNGSLCACQCGNCLFSNCPTWSQQRFIHLVKLHVATSWDVEDYYQKSSFPHSTKENVLKLTTQSCNALTLN